MKKFVALAMGALMLLSIAGCRNDSDIVSYNLSQEADKFNVLRRVVFYNGINGEYILTIEGYCSIGNDRTQIEVAIICKTGANDQYKKHFLGRSDNVTYFVEQIDGQNVSPDHYKVIFKPSTIVPDIEIR